jgi:hypothetical protein
MKISRAVNNERLPERILLLLKQYAICNVVTSENEIRAAECLE